VANQVSIATVDSRKAVSDWIAIPHAVFADDPCWVAPLDFLERRRISRRHAPFFTFGVAELFIAYRDGRPVGRISAQVNHRHLERHKDNVGHFGFFDCAQDPEAASVLVGAAAGWLRRKGLARMVGPLNFSLNEECGCLISGFDSAPAMMMTHARPWTGSLLEQTGLAKEMDLYAYRLQPDHLPKRAYQVAELARQSREVSIRPIDMKRYAEEVRTLVDIFNDAWSENWGFVPFSPAEIDALLAEMRPLFRGEYGRFLLFNGEPVGMMIGLPNLNEVTATFHGKMLPFNWLKLIGALKWPHFRSARIPLMGVRKAFHATPVAGMMLALMATDFIEQTRPYGLEWAEFSWVLETNKRVTSLAEMICGPPVKTHRIYGKAL
jgi:hypothetical protein